ncbi:MAG: hypothetical protein QW808_01205 [Desulfurococcaceae archaeon]
MNTYRGDTNLIFIGQEVLMLHKLVALLMFVLLVMISLLEMKGLTKLLLSIVLASLFITNYLVLLYISRYVDLAVYPLFVVESTSKGSTLYIDLGQVSALLAALIWRNSILKLVEPVNRYLKRIAGKIKG